MPFTNQIPLGTYTEDGLRSGPVFPTKFMGTNVTQAGPNFITQSANVTSRDYSKFGKGILYSPTFTYPITPLNSGFSQGGSPDYTPTGDIVEPSTVPTNGFLPLNTHSPINGISQNGNTATPCTYAVSKEGKPYIQFDYPRVPLVYLFSVSGSGSLPSAIPVTIFGTDGYGFPIQMTYVVQAYSMSPPTFYPNPYGAYSTPMKAFDTITDIYVNGATSGDIQLGVTSSNIFGLPYKLTSRGDITALRWNDRSLMNLNGYVQMSNGGAFAIGHLYCPAVGPESANDDGTDRGISVTYDAANGDFPADAGVLATTKITPYQLVDVYGFDPANTSAVSWTLIGGGYNLAQVGDTSTPSSFSGDPRGLIRLPSPTDFPSPQIWSSDNYPYPNGQYEMAFSYYVRGADAFINQLSASDALVGSVATPNFNQLVPLPSLSVTDMYGLPPYYTGVPD